MRLLMGLLAAGAGLLAGCHRDTVVVPAYPTDYYPVVLNTYRTYAVTDSTWKNGVATDSSYQIREAVREQFADATGQPAFRVIRSRRKLATDAWVDDSAFVVQPLSRLLLQTTANARTVELVYPVRGGHTWNANAFNGGAPDTITDQTRTYDPTVGGAFATPALGGYPAKSYPATATTRRILPTGGEETNLYSQKILRQVYARGTGRVLRLRASKDYTIYVSGEPLFSKDPQNGISRLEVLVDAGPL